MRLPNAARIARRELRGGIKGFRVFLACLALGVAAIAAVGSVRHSIELGLQQEGAAILGGDAEIQLTYRFAEVAERAWMETVASEVSEIVDFRSMAVVEGEAAADGTVVYDDGSILDVIQTNFSKQTDYQVFTNRFWFNIFFEIIFSFNLFLNYRLFYIAYDTARNKTNNRSRRKGRRIGI